MSQGLAQGSGVDQNGRPWVSEPSWTQPVYKYNTAAVPVTKEILGDYTKKITDEIFRESPFLELLKQKTRKAEDALKKDINRTIWGEAPVRNEELRRCIGDAYDKHGPIRGKEVTVIMYDETNIAEAAVRKRKEARAEALADEVGTYLEGHDWESGDQFTWTVTFHDSPDKTYHYVALRGGNAWYLTGRSGRISTDGLLGIIIDLGLRGSIDTHDW